MKIKNLSRFERLPLTVLSSFGHNGLDWVHSLLDGHADILLMPAFSYFRTLDFFRLKYGYSICDKPNQSQLAEKLTEFLYKDPSYKVVRRRFLHNDDDMEKFKAHLVIFLENSSINSNLKRLFYGLHYAFCVISNIDLNNIRTIVHQEHVSWHGLEYEKIFKPSFIFVMRDPRAGLAGAWKRQSENAGMERLNPFDFDKTILAGTYLEAFYKKLKNNNDGSKKVIVMVNEKMHENLEREMRNLCEWLDIGYQESCLEETFLGKEWLGESSYLAVDELTERPPLDFYDIDKIESRWRNQLKLDDINMIETVYKDTFLWFDYKKDFVPNRSNQIKGILRFHFLYLINQDEGLSIKTYLKAIRNFVRRAFILYFPLLTSRLFLIP